MHTAWGRTLKDVFQRYKALRGFDQRYQNGFDCQGLWIEVGVERELGLNSKREIEEYGLEEFAAQVPRRRRVVGGGADAGSKRLGQWMDWGNDYFTFSDTNIEYIWRFLKIVHERGWLYLGHRSTEWCPRCGTSISAHELAGSYVDRADPSLYVRFPLLDRPGEALVIWTTTPWTLPANVAAAVQPGGRVRPPPNGEWVAAPRYPDERFDETLPGVGARRLALPGAVRRPAPRRAASSTASIPWDEVGAREGTGIVHIAPAAAPRTSSSRARTTCPCCSRWTRRAASTTTTAGCTASRPSRRPSRSSATSSENGRARRGGPVRAPLSRVLALPHAARSSGSPTTGSSPSRDPRADARANATVEWTPEYMGKRMDDWLVNMGDWNISRRRYYGLPLPFYPCACGHLTVVGSRAELEERARRRARRSSRSCAGRGSTA